MKKLLWFFWVSLSVMYNNLMAENHSTNNKSWILIGSGIGSTGLACSLIGESINGEDQKINDKKDDIKIKENLLKTVDMPLKSINNIIKNIPHNKIITVTLDQEKCQVKGDNISIENTSIKTVMEKNTNGIIKITHMNYMKFEHISSDIKNKSSNNLLPSQNNINTLNNEILLKKFPEIIPVDTPIKTFEELRSPVEDMPNPEINLIPTNVINNKKLKKIKPILKKITPPNSTSIVSYQDKNNNLQSSQSNPSPINVLKEEQKTDLNMKQDIEKNIKEISKTNVAEKKDKDIKSESMKTNQSNIPMNLSFVPSWDMMAKNLKEIRDNNLGSWVFSLIPLIF